MAKLPADLTPAQREAVGAYIDAEVQRRTPSRPEADYRMNVVALLSPYFADDVDKLIEASTKLSTYVTDGFGSTMPQAAAAAVAAGLRACVGAFASAVRRPHVPERGR